MMIEYGAVPTATGRGVVAAFVGMAAATAAATVAVMIGWVPLSGLLEQVLAELLVLAGLGAAIAAWRGIQRRRSQLVEDPPPGSSTS